MPCLPPSQGEHVVLLLLRREGKQILVDPVARFLVVTKVVGKTLRQIGIDVRIFVFLPGL